MIDKINETKLEHRRIVVPQSFSARDLFEIIFANSKEKSAIVEIVSAQSAKERQRQGFFVGSTNSRHEFERGSLYFSGSLSSNATI